MKKVIVLGCSGSGKSVFARRLQERTGLPIICLDSIWWKPDRSHISRDEFDAALAEALRTDAWIFDGDYSRTYTRMNEAERRQLMESLIAEIQVYEERKPNGQWLKSIRFKLPIIEESMHLGLDKDDHVESVIRLDRIM